VKSLRELVTEYHESLLRDIAGALGLPAGGDRAELVSKILTFMASPGFPTANLQRLKPEQWLALRLVAAAGPSGVVVDKCHQRLNQLVGNGRRRVAGSILFSLIREGLVCLDHVNYRDVYLVPTEVRQPLASLLDREMVAQLRVRQVKAVPLDGRFLLRFTHHYLGLAWRQRLGLTRSGHLKHQAVLAFSAFGDRRTFGWTDGPEPLDFVDGFCRRRGLVLTGPGMLTAAADLEDWIELAEEHKQAELFRYWQKEHMTRDADFRLILSILRSMPPGVWADEQRLLRETRVRSPEPPRGAMESRLSRHFWSYLTALGVLEKGRGPSGPAWRLTGAGRRVIEGGPSPGEITRGGASFYVQPDFELVLPPDVDLGCLWQVSRLADLLSADQVMVYRLSRAGFHQALKLGMDPAEAMAFLHGRACGGLPQNVEYTLRSWTAGYGRVHFVEAFLLRCDDPALAEEILASRRLAPLIRGRLTPQDLVVNREDLPRLQELLQEEGYVPPPGVADLAHKPPAGEITAPRRPE